VLRLPAIRSSSPTSHLEVDTFFVSWRHDFPWFTDNKAEFVLNSDAQVAELKLAVPNEDFWFEDIDLTTSALHR
jgi:hypothetical protein